MWEVEVRRGDLVESRHTLWGAAISAPGTVDEETAPGDADRIVFLRSAAKPFQAAGAVDAGVLDRFGLDDRHLAVACASHGGDDESVDLVRDILTSAGIEERALDTGDDGQGGPLRHQCSGNHALALAWCVAEGWPISGYLAPDHPVQVAMADRVRRAAGDPLVHAADNCGMTTYGVTLSTVGRMFVGLARGEGAGLRRVRDAMADHPLLIGSTPGIDSELMVANAGLVAKVGAEGLTAAATTDGALVVKIGDGQTRAMVPGVRALASRWTSWIVGELAVPLHDAHGRPVGELVAVRSPPPG